MRNLDRATFNKLRKYIYENSGISLKEGKEALMSARISRRMRVLGIDNYRKYYKYVLEDETGEETVHLLDAISTNVTNFFREPEHFGFVSEMFDRWVRAGQLRFRFWSAACSSGEEPYSLAMTLLETLGSRKVDVRILATDISTKVLRSCAEGHYREGKIKDVPLGLKRKYFHEHLNGDRLYIVRDGVKRLVTFARLNLSNPPFPMRGPMDIIMCRNVMIYFDNLVRKRLLDELYRLLKPGGYLLVGHAESLTGMVSSFKTVRPSIFIKD